MRLIVLKRILFTLILLISAAALTLSACIPLPLAAGRVAQDPPPAAQASALDRPGLLVRKVPVGSQYQLVAVDLRDGSAEAAYEPLDVGYEMMFGFSPDRRQLAVTGKGAGCRVYCLQIIDLDSWQVTGSMELETIHAGSEWISGLIFNQQGNRLLVIANHQNRPLSSYALIDLSRMQLAHQSELGAIHLRAAFSEDGSQLMVVGAQHPLQPGVPESEPSILWSALMDAGSLELIWEQPVYDILYGMYSTDGSQRFESLEFVQPAVVLDAARKRAWIAHASEDVLTRVDFERQQVDTHIVTPQRSWFERLLERLISLGVTPAHAKVQNMMSRFGLLSADGSQLYLVSHQSRMIQDGSDWRTEQTTSGLQVWDLEQHVLVGELQSQAPTLRWGLGKVMLVGWKDSPNHPDGLAFTEVYDPLQEQVVERLEGVEVFQTIDLDGNPLLVSTDYRSGTTIHTVLGADFTPLYTWEDRHSFWLWFE